MPAAANAGQSAFPAIGRALTAGTGTAIVNTMTASQIDAALSYRPDPQLSAQMRANAVAAIPANNRMRARFEQAFGDGSALQTFEKIPASRGYSGHNIADAMATMLWVSWQLVNGAQLTDAQIGGIHQQTRAVFLGNADLRALPYPARQQFAETLGYAVMTLVIAVQTNDPATVAEARQSAGPAVKQMIGLDFADVEVTADSGFRPKRAGVPLAAGPAGNGAVAAQTPPPLSPDMKACADKFSSEFSQRIEACTRVVAANPGNIAVLFDAYVIRSGLHEEVKQLDRMMADLEEAVRIAPANPLAYVIRAGGLTARRDYDRALADVEKALASQPNSAEAYAVRANIYLRKASYDRAMADSTRAIGIKPDVSFAWAVRALAQLEQGNNAAALTDVNEAVRLEPRDEHFRVLRAEIWLRQGQTEDARAEVDRVQGWNRHNARAQLIRGRIALAEGRVDVALAEMTLSLDQDDQQPFAFGTRAAALERAGWTERALADYRRALTLTPDDKQDRDAQATARERIAALTAVAPNPPAGVAALAEPPSRRIALVIGMGAYANVPALRNPVTDARAVADAFRRLGFAEVIEREDLTRAKLEETLKDFGDKAGEADWAVIYYAGHGVEMNGVNYLVPVDARLARAEHVEDEAITLTRVLSKAEAAHKLRMVILDACRNNPFRMAAAEGRTRSLNRGLSAVEPARGVLVAYAARDGTTADDGDNGHSPFTQALLANLEAPNVDIRIMFSKVRDQVLTRTNNIQEPFTYGSLPGQEFYFKPAAR
jgi:tetratricopeptide (TPR) repeat protein